MERFSHLRLGLKLQIAFFSCALITLIIGGLGSLGVARLSSGLQQVFAQDLVWVAKVAEAKAAAISQNRDLYVVLSMTMGRPVTRAASAMNARTSASRKLSTCCAERLVEARLSAASAARTRFIWGEP